MNPNTDLYNNAAGVLALTAVARTASANGVGVDRKGYESLMFLVQAGAVTAADASNKFTASLEESDDNSAFTAVAAAQVQGSAVVDGTADANTFIGKLGYYGSKRYVRVVMTETGTFDGVVGVTAVLSGPRKAPVA